MNQSTVVTQWEGDRFLILHRTLGVGVVIDKREDHWDREAIELLAKHSLTILLLMLEAQGVIS